MKPFSLAPNSNSKVSRVRGAVRKQRQAAGWARRLGAIKEDSVLQVRDLIPRSSVFPPVHRCLLHFGNSEALNAPNTNLAVEQAWILNTLFNIDSTGGTGLPFQYAQFSAIYKKYRVLRAVGSVKIYDVSADGYVGGICLRGPSISGALLVDFQNRQQDNTKPISNTGEQVIEWKFDVDMAKAFGEPAMAYRANYGAVMGAQPGAGSPDYCCFLRVGGWSIPGGVAITARVSIDVTMETELFDLIL